MIACSGCYMIDFVLSKFNFEDLSEYTLSGRQFTSYESLLIKLMHHIKLYLTTQYPLNWSTSTSTSTSTAAKRSSTASISHGPVCQPICRDSILSYYILFIGHLTATDRGNSLIELFKLSDLILQIVDIYKDLNLMKLIVSSLNFYQSPKSRLILERCLCMTVSGEQDAGFFKNEFIDRLHDFKLYTLKLVFNLYRANNQKFETALLNVVFKSVFALVDDRWESALLDPRLGLDQNKIELLVEFTLNLVEFFLNQRPEFINKMLEFYYDESTFIDMLHRLSTHSVIIRKSRILDTKLKLLVFKFKLSEVNLNTIELKDEQRFIEEQLKEWYSVQRMHVSYFQLIERYLFDANSINLSYINELDDRPPFK
jgi:hypothetical protein